MNFIFRMRKTFFKKTKTKMAAVKIQHKNCFQSTQRKKKNKRIICRPWSVRIGKNRALGLQYSPWPAASGHIQDLWHSFSQYRPPGRQITYVFYQSKKCELLLTITLNKRYYFDSLFGLNNVQGCGFAAPACNTKGWILLIYWKI